MTRLFALAYRYGWEIGYLDEVWWSRVSQPNLHSWSDQDEPLRLQELAVDKNDPDPKALVCYGMLSAGSSRMHLRFVSGRPARGVTTDFLEWLRQHNQAVLQETQIGKRGVRIIPCWLPTKSRLQEPPDQLTSRE